MTSVLNRPGGAFPVSLITIGVTIMVLSGPAMAQDPPPPVYFTGTYRMVGTAPDGPVDMTVRLVPDAAALVLSGCDGTAGRLEFDTGFEGGFFLNGDLSGLPVMCQFFNDYDNYPLIACAHEDDMRLTLWPDPARNEEQCDRRRADQPRLRINRRNAIPIKASPHGSTG